MSLSPTAAPVAGLLGSVPFVALLGLFVAMLGYLLVVVGLMIGTDGLRRYGSGFVVGGGAVYVLLF